jgi:chromosome segregation ATPase
VVTSKRNVSLAPVLTRALLAVCVSSTLVLAACDSATSVNGSAAAKASNDAARLSASAGDVRPKEEFVKTVEDKNDDEVRQIGDTAYKAITGDQLNARGVWKNYLEQKTVASDLDTAAGFLNDALKDDSLGDPAIKSVIQAQLGATQLAEARLQLAQAGQTLLELTSRAADFQIAAAYINGLGASAAEEDARAKGDAPADLTKYKSDVEDRKAATAKAQEAVDKIEKEVSDKQAQAAKIYADTDAAFAQAENLKGTEAIDAANKAADARKEGDKLTEDVQNLQPQVAQAHRDLMVAQIQQADAESQLTTATSAGDQSMARQKSATDQAAVLHDQAKKLIDGDSGLAARYKEFSDLATKLKADVSKADDYAAKSARAYADALASAGKFASRISDLQLDSSDPLNKAAKDTQAKALLTLAQAAAREEVAQANLIGYTAANLSATAATAMSQAYKAAAEPQEAGVAAADKDKTENEDAALREFKAAGDSAKAVADGAKDGSPEKWLGYTLAAVALHGQYLINGQNKSEYVAAGQAAEAQNPFLQLNALAGTGPEPAAR